MQVLHGIKLSLRQRTPSEGHDVGGDEMVGGKGCCVM
jgi:hypothetical protein